MKHKQTEFIEGRRSPSCFYSRDELLAALNSDLSSLSSACPALDDFSVVAGWRKAISGHWCMRRALLFVVLSFGVHLSTRYDKISRYCADFSFTFYPLQASQSEDKISLFVRCRFVWLWASVSYHSFNKRRQFNVRQRNRNKCRCPACPSCFLRNPRGVLEVTSAVMN